MTRGWRGPVSGVSWWHFNAPPNAGFCGVIGNNELSEDECSVSVLYNVFGKPKTENKKIIQATAFILANLFGDGAPGAWEARLLRWLMLCSHTCCSGASAVSPSSESPWPLRLHTVRAHCWLPTLLCLWWRFDSRVHSFMMTFSQQITGSFGFDICM